MYLLWRAVRFLTITGALLYTFTSLTPQIFSTSDWIGKKIQTASQRQVHTAALAQLRGAGNLFGDQQAPAPAELLGSADQPRSIKEYYRDAR